MEKIIDELQREIASLKRKLERSETSRRLIEQAKDQYDLVYRTSIKRLDLQKALLNAQNRELDSTKEELIRKNKELEEAQLVAEAANEAKGRFLANMSHEIRTPLNGILGFLELMDLTPLEPKQKNYLKEMRVASELLMFLINDILDFSKIEAGHLEIESRAFQFQDAIRKSLSIIGPLAEKKGIALEAELDPTLPTTVMGDASRLLQVLNNLLGNAVKFTDKGFVRLTVTALSKSGNVREIKFDVEDSGIGLQGLKANDLFNPFSQADSSITRRFGGTGLGLAIAKELIHLMGGTIKAESSIAGGALFSMLIPLTVVSQDPLHLQKSDDLSNFKALSPLKILLAEDNSVNIRLVEIMLEKMGLNAEVVNTGKRALERCMEEAFDLILMDGQMPEMDGYEASRLIRTLPNPSSGAYILAMTANAMAGDKARCLESGMDDDLTKPMHPKDFFAKIRSISELVHQKKEQQRQVFFTQAMLEEVENSLLRFEKEIGCGARELWDLARLFAEDILPKLEDLKNSVHNHEENDALRLLHTMIGSTGNMGFEYLLIKLADVQQHVLLSEWALAETVTMDILQYVNAMSIALFKKE